MISGLLAALGGLVTTAVVTEANPAASPAIIFNALTAVALAGVALTGGRGSLPAGPRRRADPRHDLQRPDDPRHPAVLGDGVDRCPAARVARPSSVSIQTSVSDRLMSTANLSVHQKRA